MPDEIVDVVVDREIAAGESIRSSRGDERDELGSLLEEERLIAVHVDLSLVRGDEREAACGALTDRETEVLARVAEGMRNREIAQALWIAPGTVRKHLDNIYAKLGARTRTAAVRLAQERVPGERLSCGEFAIQ